MRTKQSIFLHMGKYYKNLVSSYLFILLFFIFSSMSTYFYARSISVSNEIRYAQSYTGFVKTIVDSKISSVKEISYMLLSEEDNAGRSFNGKNVMEELNKIATLTNMVSNLRTLGNCYFYNRSLDKIYSSEGSVSFSTFAGYTPPGGLNKEIITLIDETVGFAYFPVVREKNGNSDNLIMFIAGRNFEEDSSKIVSTMDEYVMMNIYYNETIKKIGEFMIVNSDGFIISSSERDNINYDTSVDFISQLSGGNDSFFVNKNLMICSKSDVLDWYYILKLDSGYINSTADKIRNMQFAFMLLTLVFGTIFIIVFSNKIYEPVKGMVAKIKLNSGNAKKLNEFDLIDDTFTNLKYENKRFREDLSLYRLINSGKTVEGLENSFEDSCFFGIVIKCVRIEDCFTFIKKYGETNSLDGFVFKAVSCNGSEILSFINAENNRG